MECLACVRIRPFDRLVLDSIRCASKHENEYFEPFIWLLEQVLNYNPTGQLEQFSISRASSRNSNRI